MSIRDAILSAQDRKFEYVDIPEWGNLKVKVRSLSVAQMEAVELKKHIAQNATDGLLRLVVMCVVDEDNKQAFSYDDIAALKDKHADPIKRLIDVCLKVNKLTAQDAEQLKKN